MYHNGGFRIRLVLMDEQFECTRGDLLSVQVLLNTMSCDEHVGDIERFIRTIKERMRCTFTTGPFLRIPQMIELGKRAVFWVNAFPALDGISTTLSPHTIVTGQTLNHDRHCSYDNVQTHEEHDNSMAPRTVGALALRLTGNAQGCFYFFSLDSIRIINQLHATCMTESPNWLDSKMRAQGWCSLTAKKNPHNEGREADDDDDDETYQPDDDDEDNYHNKGYVQ